MLWYSPGGRYGAVWFSQQCFAAQPGRQHRPLPPACWLLAAGCWPAPAGEMGRLGELLVTDVYVLYVESCLPSDEHAPDPFAVAFVACTIELLIVNVLFIAYISINDAPAEPSIGLLDGTSPVTGRTCKIT